MKEGETAMSKRIREAAARMDARMRRAFRDVDRLEGSLKHWHARCRRLEEANRRLQRENTSLYRESKAFRLKVCELEERIHDMLDPWTGVQVRQADGNPSNGPVAPEHWFYEPAELAETLVRMAKAHPDTDRVVFRLGNEYVLAKSVAYEEMPVEGDGNWYDPAIVFNLEK